MKKKNDDEREAKLDWAYIFRAAQVMRLVIILSYKFSSQ